MTPSDSILVTLKPLVGGKFWIVSPTKHLSIVVLPALSNPRTKAFTSLGLGEKKLYISKLIKFTKRAFIFIISQVYYCYKIMNYLSLSKYFDYKSRIKFFVELIIIRLKIIQTTTNLSQINFINAFSL